MELLGLSVFAVLAFLGFSTILGSFFTVNTAEVAIIPLDAGIAGTAAITRVTVTGEVVGSVALAPGGATALVYSNAAHLERITVLTLSATPSYRVVKLHAPVLSVFPTADAANEPSDLERDQDDQGVRDRDPGRDRDGAREHRSGK